MSLFFFHVHDGHEIRDEVGVELPGLPEARQQAIVASGEMLKEYGRAFWDGQHWQMYVSDEAGNTVIRLNFSAETEGVNKSTRGAEPQPLPFG